MPISSSSASSSSCSPGALYFLWAAARSTSLALTSSSLRESRARSSCRRRCGIRKRSMQKRSASSSSRRRWPCGATSFFSNTSAAVKQTRRSLEASKPRWKAKLSFRFPGGHTKGRRVAEMTAASRHAVSTHWKSTPRISMRPRLGERGIRESVSPSGNMRSMTGTVPFSDGFEASWGGAMAPSCTNSRRADSTADSAGGSGARARKSRTSRCIASAWRQVAESSHLCISGAVRQGVDSN
mmetsp:Transcript_7081/g.12655  ORF Transcript_7081/g.12655 Transcript_7081/m.12655 type:complete len:240 (+) Transcript_7081:938-1657(+)